MGKDETARHLQLVNTETGELVDADSCPGCKERDRTINEWKRKFNGVLSQLGKLRADKEAEARADQLWPHAVAIFRYWQERTSHHKAEFTVERFEIIAKRLRTHGPEECRRAIDGCLLSDWHQKRGPASKRKGEVFDSLPIIFEKQDNWEKFRALATPRETIRGATLLQHAQEVAKRVLERARLIEQTDPDDLPAIGHLLLEIDRLNREWLAHGTVPTED